MHQTTDRTRLLLERAWQALAGEPDLLAAVDVRGDERGLLPSRLAALPAMAAAVAASTLAAATLDGVRRAARPAPVSVDVEHVAIAAHSERHARQEGAAAAALFAPLSRFWRTTDGWLRLHANYPWHRERALAVLGCRDEPEAVAAAVRDWRGEDLEAALVAAGALGALVRTRAEWERHRQGHAVAGLPLVERSAGGGDGSRPGRRQEGGRFADGVRVLDLTRVIAGPVATRTLAGWGADVLRLDSPSLPEAPGLALDALPGKASALVDLTGQPGRAMLEELLAAADVVVLGYRPGSLDRFGLALRDLVQRRPALVVVSLSGWGAAGPWADRRGFDSLVQCSTGIAVAEGSEAAPGALPAQVLDHATGYLAAAAALLGLAARDRGEPPGISRLSLAQTARWLLDAQAGVPDPARAIAAEPYLVSLAAAGARVQVVGPPGQVGEVRPRWTATGVYGADPPAFRTGAGPAARVPAP